MVYTSGDDRIFPRGFPVGIVRRPAGQPFKEILVERAGCSAADGRWLILIEGVHQPIPDAPPGCSHLYRGPRRRAAIPRPRRRRPRPRGQRRTGCARSIGRWARNRSTRTAINPPGAKPVDFTRLGNPGSAGPGYPSGPAGRIRLATAATPPKTDTPSNPNVEAGRNSPSAPGSPPATRPGAPARDGTGGTAPATGGIRLRQQSSHPRRPRRRRRSRRPIPTWKPVRIHCRRRALGPPHVRLHR